MPPADKEKQTTIQDPTDTFEDIPFDFRHHRFRKKPRFPIEWGLTAQRAKYLERQRHERQLLDQQRAEQEKLISGVAEIEKFHGTPQLVTPSLAMAPLAAAAPRGAATAASLRQKAGRLLERPGRRMP